MTVDGRDGTNQDAPNANPNGCWIKGGIGTELIKARNQDRGMTMNEIWMNKWNLGGGWVGWWVGVGCVGCVCMGMESWWWRLMHGWNLGKDVVGGTSGVLMF